MDIDDFFGTAYAAAVPNKPEWKNIIFTTAHNLVQKKDGKISRKAANILFVPAIERDGSFRLGMYDAVPGGLGTVRPMMFPQTLSTLTLEL